MTYLIARADCGCIQAATDVNINDADLGAMVLDWMRRNLKIEKVIDAPRLGLCPLHTELKEKDAEIESLKARLDGIRVARDEAQAVLLVLNRDPAVATFQIAASFQTMGNKVGSILQDGEPAPKYPPRDNWVHHIDFGRDDFVTIHRHDGTMRSYRLTKRVAQRLENIIDGLCWSWRPPTTLDPEYMRIKNRAVAPMRRFQ